MTFSINLNAQHGNGMTPFDLAVHIRLSDTLGMFVENQQQLNKFWKKCRLTNFANMVKEIVFKCQDFHFPCRVMTSIVFNSVPMEDIEANWGSNPGLDRVKSVIREIKRYVVLIFESWASGKLFLFFPLQGTELLMFSSLKIYSSWKIFPKSPNALLSFQNWQPLTRTTCWTISSHVLSLKKKKLNFFLCDPYYLFSNWIFFYSYICH